MISIFKQGIFFIAEIFHWKIFGQEMSDEMRKFLGNLLWSFLGGMIVAGILFILNIVVGRWLGSVEYGKYSLVVAISAIFIILMTLGIDMAVTHYIAKSEPTEEKNNYLNSAFWLVLSLILVVSFLLLIFSRSLANFFSTQIGVIEIALVLSVFLALKNILNSFMKGFNFFRLQSIIKILEASVIFATFFVFALGLSVRNFRMYVVAIIFGYSLSILLMILKFKKHLSLTNKYTKIILSYGLYAALGSVSGVLLNSLDKIFINKFIGSTQLGIYNAYSTASILIVSQLAVFFIDVFFPHLSAFPNKDVALKKINKLAKIFFVPEFLLMCLVIPVVIFLFGKQYLIKPILVVEFGFLASLMLYFTVLWWLIASKSRSGIRFTSINGIIAGLILVSLTLVFRVKLNLCYAVLFLIFAIFYGVIIGNLKYARIK